MKKRVIESAKMESFLKELKEIGTIDECIKVYNKKLQEISEISILNGRNDKRKELAEWIAYFDYLYPEFKLKRIGAI